MPYIVIDDAVFDFDRPLASSTMRALRDNITRVTQGNQMVVSVPWVSNAYGISYASTSIATVISAGGVLLGVRIVGTPSGIGGTLLSVRASGTSGGSIVVNAVITGTNNSASVTIVPIIGSFGGLTT